MTTASPSRTQVRTVVRTLLVPTIVFLISLVMTGVAAAIPGLDYSAGKSHPIPLALAETVLILSAATLFNRVLDLFVWPRIQMSGQPVPRLIGDLVVAVVWYSAACAVAAYAFNQSLTQLLAASTLVLGVVGLALQRIILDAFSGIVIALQRPFGMGDWLAVTGDPSVYGQVIEMNWRAVHLVTPNEVLHVVPNSQFTSNGTRVFSKPSPYFREEITITLPLNLPPLQAQRILLGATYQVEEVSRLPRKSVVTISEYTDRGVVWKLYFWCVDPRRLHPIRFEINQNILKNLKFVGVDVPVSTLNLRRAATLDDGFAPIQGVEPQIQRLSLFAALTVDELQYLSSHCHSRLAVASVPLLREGDEGDSLFVLCEGLLEVSKTDAQGGRVVVGRIHPGQFFGERTFLLGEPRGATVVPVIDAVVIEITKSAMTTLLQGRPDLATHLAEVLAERHAATDAKLNSTPSAPGDAEGLMDKLVDRIVVFFDIKKQRAKSVAPAPGIQA